MSSSEEKTPTISPDQGATGETTSSENKEALTQTGWLSVTKYKCVEKGSSQQQRTQQISSITFFKSEEEKKAHLDEIECNAIMGMMNSLKTRNPEAYQDIIIETLYKQFARENRATRVKGDNLFRTWQPGGLGGRVFGDLWPCAWLAKKGYGVCLRRCRIWELCDIT